MAYRELWCNVQDEAGTVTVTAKSPSPRPGHTQIIVHGEALLQVHAERHKWILQSEPLFKHESCNVHPGNSKTVFYRGIAVAELSHPSLFTYNIQQKVRLTEDRTLDSYSARYPIVEAWLKAGPRDMLKHVLLASDATMEHSLDFDWSSITPSRDFVAITEELFHTRLAKTNRSAVMRCHKLFTKPEHKSVPLTVVEQKMLAKALAFLRSMGYNVTQEICVVETLGSQWNLGLAKEGRIFIPKHIFGKGTKYVASTLLEEHLHLSLDLHDCSRELQDWLFDKVLSLAEELRGEPL